MNNKSLFKRRDFLKLLGAGAAASGISNPILSPLAFASDDVLDKKILVVLELSGGNDGLNTLVPYGDDAYYRHRPTLGIKPNKLRKIDNHFGFNPDMAGMERLFKDGNMAIFHGCGYDQPSYSHFTSMAYWQTAAPNSGESLGWVGRLADALNPSVTPNYLVNVDATQSLAVVALSLIHI